MDTPELPVQKKQPLWPKVALSLTSVLFAILAIEVGLRLTGFNSTDLKETDAATGLRVFRANTMQPYRTSCFSNTLEINNHGFHAPDYEIEKPANTRRIVIVGDSFVESAQVPIQKSFWHLLEEKLNAASASGTRVEVIPFGIGGNGTLANLDYLVRYGFAVHPDLVIDAFNTSDVDNDAETADLDAQLASLDEPHRSSSEVATGWAKKLAKKSALIVTLYSKYLGWKSVKDIGQQTAIRPPVFEEKFYAQPTDAADRAWAVQRKIFERMKTFADANGANMLVVAMADAPRFPPLREDFVKQFAHPENIVLDRPERTLGSLSEGLGVAYLSLFPAFDERVKAEGPTDLSWPCDAHYNETGHAWAADALFTYLTAHSDLYAHP